MHIGKSSLYNYYKSKDEILFAVYLLAGDDYIEQLKIYLLNDNTLKEKLYTYFRFYRIEIIETPNLKDLYKEYTITSLENKTEHMIKINEKFLLDSNILLEQIFNEEIKKGTIKKEALDFVEFLQMNVDGIFLYSYGLKDFNLKQKVEKFIDSFIKLIKI
jgi:AcrR family transcriptional regulator